MQGGDHFAHSLGGAGGGGDDVAEDGTAAAPVFLGRAVNGLLGGGGGVNRRHQTFHNAEVLVNHLCQRSQAVGGARCIGDDGLASVFLVVHAHDEHRGVVFGRSGHHNAFGTCFEVSLSEFLGEEQTGGLDYVVGTHFVPFQVGGILFCGDADLVAVDH